MTDQTLDPYATAAPWWADRMRGLGYEAAYGEMLDQLVPTRPGAVCDMGAGTGTLAAALVARLGWPDRLTLVDRSAAMLAQARAVLPGAECVASTLDGYGVQGAFDLVTSAHLIEHLDDPVAGLRAMTRLLTPGGRLLLIVSRPHWCQWVIWLRWRHRWFAPDTVQAMARAADLRPLATTGFASGPPRRTSRAYLFTLATETQA